MKLKFCISLSSHLATIEQKKIFFPGDDLKIRVSIFHNSIESDIMNMIFIFRTELPN